MNAPSKIRVLIVDDNDVIRRTLRGILRQDDGVEYVGEATCGETAIEAIKTHSPDVVCLDVRMPRTDGFAVLEFIRETAKNVRVVIITGSPTSEVVANARRLGAAGFVVKPFNGAKVLGAIHSAMQVT